jgi:cytochrome c oxidase subunit II
MQGAHTVLDPASPQAVAIAHQVRLFFAVAAIIWLVVLGFLTYSLLRPRALGARDHDSRFTRRQTTAVSGAVALSALILLVLGFVDLGTGREIETARASSSDTLHIRLTGRQWWWQVQYEQATPPYRVATANEMHIPLGRPVVLTLESSDVIHSFWAPNLHGKSDLIPGYSSGFLIQADSPGVYRAPCAEYCGAQHAKMTLLIVAQPADSFAAWYANQMRNAPEPKTAAAARGRDVFLTSACPFCHTIRGTPSGGSVAPDLTHLATRATLAAGTLPNRREQLAGWIANPQGIKPGNHMPANLLTGRDLKALLDYLTTLQ